MKHGLAARLLGRHDWVPLIGDSWPGGLIIFREACGCGARRERWHRWRDGELTDAERAALR